MRLLLRRSGDVKCNAASSSTDNSKNTQSTIVRGLGGHLIFNISFNILYL